MNKKILVGVVALVLPLAACGDDDNDGNDDITTVDVGDVTDVGDDGDTPSAPATGGADTTMMGGMTTPSSTGPMMSTPGTTAGG